MTRRVVVTGIGIVSPYGVGTDIFWNSVKAGKSGIKLSPVLDSDKHSVHIAGDVSDYDALEYFDPKEAKKTDRYIQFAVIAADEAFKDSGIDMAKEDVYRVGVYVSSAAGGFTTIEAQHKVQLEKGPTRCSPFTIPNLIVNIGSGKVSMKIGAKGPNKCVVSACASAANAIGDAFRSIAWGDADVIFAGGSEAAICDMGIGGFTSARTLSKRNDEPQKASRPYDVDRDGFVMAEGAGVIVLEELEHAKARGAKIYAEIIGYGQTSDAFDIVAPDPSGAAAQKAMELAVKNANIKPEDVDYINTHGTSTGLGDKAESFAVANLFGDLSKNQHLKVSSTKSMFGHMLGASGAAESIVCIKAINEGIVPPTINLDNQDPEVANLNYVPHKAIEQEVNIALTNSFGFGGHNASLIFKKYQ